MNSAKVRTGGLFNHLRIIISKRFNRFFYDYIYYSTWLTKNLKFFNLGITPVDTEIESNHFVVGEKHQAQVYFEVIKAYQRHASHQTPDKVLEISVGLGGGLQLLAHSFPNAQLFGLDYSKTSARRTQQLVPQASLLVADAHFVPLISQHFALLVNVESLHALKMQDFFQEARRLLQVDGLLIIIDFRKGRIHELHNRLAYEAQLAHLEMLEFTDLTERVLASSLIDNARRKQLKHRVPLPFRKWVNEMTAAEGSVIRKQYEAGEKTYFLCVLRPCLDVSVQS